MAYHTRTGVVVPEEAVEHALSSDCGPLPLWVGKTCSAHTAPEIPYTEDAGSSGDSDLGEMRRQWKPHHGQSPENEIHGAGSEMLIRSSQATETRVDIFETLRQTRDQTLKEFENGAAGRLFD